ncbi:MAG: hypothetical protein A4E39_01154 [Methanoregulaceae archaeon PtaB.Bin152]|nr:MAG: hypothetical protein A4E39_01154 [Methanoregulaceae archaeon PtaB.Bin152]OPY42710.1 MAG: hypothetical protein A4E41_00147 [Methanoregulaceae archaeon PtaU1.Bin066]
MYLFICLDVNYIQQNGTLQEFLMSWQDIALTFFIFLAGVLLIPQLRDTMNHGAVVNFFTASLTSVLLFCISGIFASLGLWISVIAQSFVGVIWLFLAFFSLRNVRDSQFPDQSLFFVARDFFGVWVLGSAFMVSNCARRLFRRD